MQIKKIFTCLLFMLFSEVAFSDSVGNINPALTARIGVAGSACTATYEKGMTAAGRSLICYGGVWREVDLKGKTQVSEYYVYSPADNYTTKVLIAYCPVGQRAIGGDCNFDGGTTQHKNVLGHTDGDRGYWCFFAFQYVSYPETTGYGVQSRADCIDI